MLVYNKARLSAIAIITVLFTAIAFFGSKLLIAKDASIEKKLTFTEWYDVSSLNQVSGAPRGSAPPSSDPDNCAINNPSSGMLCAIELTVPTADYTLPGTYDVDNLPAGVSKTGQDAHQPEN